MWDLNTDVPQDKTTDFKTMSYYSFCHFASVNAVTVCLRTYEDNWSYFLLFASGGLAVWKAVTLIAVWEQRREERRRKEGEPEERRCSEHGRNQFRAQQYREEKSWAWNVIGRKVKRPESDSSNRSPLQWLFDLQLVWTVTVKVLEINDLTLFSTTGKVIVQFNRTFYPWSSVQGTEDTNPTHTLYLSIFIKWCSGNMSCSCYPPCGKYSEYLWEWISHLASWIAGKSTQAAIPPMSVIQENNHNDLILPVQSTLLAEKKDICIWLWILNYVGWGSFSFWIITICNHITAKRCYTKTQFDCSNCPNNHIWNLKPVLRVFF